MKHTIRYDEDNQLVVQQIIGELTSSEAETFGQRYEELFEGKPFRHLIVDLTNAGKLESRDT